MKRIIYELLIVFPFIMICLSPCITSNAEEIIYDDDGRIVEVVHDDGTVTRYVYDDNGNMISVKNYDSERLAEDDDIVPSNNSEDDTSVDPVTPEEDNTNQDIDEIRTDKKESDSTDISKDDTIPSKKTIDGKKTDDSFLFEATIILFIIATMGLFIIINKKQRRYEDGTENEGR